MVKPIFSEVEHPERVVHVIGILTNVRHPVVRFVREATVARETNVLHVPVAVLESVLTAHHIVVTLVDLEVLVELVVLLVPSVQKLPVRVESLVVHALVEQGRVRALGALVAHSGEHARGTSLPVDPVEVIHSVLHSELALLALPHEVPRAAAEEFALLKSSGLMGTGLTQAAS